MFQSMRLGNTDLLSRHELAERVAALRLPPVLAFLASAAIPVIAAAIWICPTILAATAVRATLGLGHRLWGPPLSMAAGVVVFVVSFVLVAGTLSLAGQPGIVAGRFPRRADHPVYALRRIYGLCWTQVYYFKPLYALCLALPPLKWLLFRLFGYRGSMQFTVYPDSWIRDLPMLRFGAGTYLGNRCCIGTNICLKDGSIVVGPVTCGPGSMVGHLAIFGLGTVLGRDSEIGVGAATGFAVTIGEGASVRPRANVDSGTSIGDRTIVGTGALVGQKAMVGSDIVLKAGAVLPPGAVARTQAEADRFPSAESLPVADLHADFQEFLEHLVEEGIVQKGWRSRSACSVRPSEETDGPAAGARAG